MAAFNGFNGYKASSNGDNGFFAIENGSDGFEARDNSVAGFRAENNGINGFHAFDNDFVGFRAEANVGFGFFSINNDMAGFVADLNGGDGFYSFGNAGDEGYFDGTVVVTGNLSKGGGSFKIDHPLEPEDKFLYHSFVESPDMMNVYNGNVILDENGEAIVQLEEWFEALNRDFRYQLTCIGGFAQVYIAEEVKNNRFKIAGGIPGMKVSWQVTGIRQDPYANENRIEVEVEKPAEFKGYYLHPEAYGRGFEQGFSYVKLGYKTLEELRSEREVRGEESDESRRKRSRLRPESPASEK